MEVDVLLQQQLAFVTTDVDVAHVKYFMPDQRPSQAYIRYIYIYKTINFHKLRSLEHIHMLV